MVDHVTQHPAMQARSPAGTAHRLAIAGRFADHLAAGTAVFATGKAVTLPLPHTVAGGVPRAITGFNRWMLLQVMQDRQWRDPRFFTSQQVLSAGWQLRDTAQPIGLQIVEATDHAGVLRPEALAGRLAVYNASAIAGVPAYEAGVGLSLEAVEAAMVAAEFEPGGHVLPALVEWISMQQQQAGGLGELGDLMARAMATSLIAARLRDVHSSRAISELQLPLGAKSQQIGRAVRAEPSLLYEAVRASELVAGQTMSLIRIAEQELDVEREMRRTANARQRAVNAAPIPSHKDDAPMEMKRPAPAPQARQPHAQREAGLDAYAARLEEMFAERKAVLAVPFDQKDLASARGAVWYRPSKVWFVPKDGDIEKFREWNPSEHCLGQVAADSEVVEAFRKEMDDMGLDTSRELIADGKWHNVRVLANKGKNGSGAYVLDLAGLDDGTPVGAINNKFSGESRVWTYNGPLLTPEQKARMRATALHRAEIADREARAAQASAAINATAVLSRSEPARDHPYLRRKGIPATGLHEVAGRVLLEYPEFYGESGKTIVKPDQRYLVVPMQTAAGEIRAVQIISENGQVKSFMRGAQKNGTMAVLGATTLDTLCSRATAQRSALDVAFVEGFATGASWFRATGIPTVVCFDAGNLEVVASDAARRLPPEIRAVLAGDNDQFHVEKALGFLADKLGLNPNSRRGSVVEVLSTPTRSRLVSLGDAVADGEWHQAPQGRYRMSLEREVDSTEVRAISIEALGMTDQKPIRAHYNNRGVEAVRFAAAAFAKRIEKEGGPSAVVVVPEFVDIAGRPTDWNDLECASGAKEAQRQVFAALGHAPAVERAPTLASPMVTRASGNER